MVCFRKNGWWGEAPALPQGPRKAIVVPKPRNGQRRMAAEPDPANAIVDWHPLINYLQELSQKRTSGFEPGATPTARRSISVAQFLDPKRAALWEDVVVVPERRRTKKAAGPPKAPEY
jgi:hypothetical protein